MAYLARPLSGILVACICPLALAAQQGLPSADGDTANPAAEEDARPMMRAVRVGAPITLDGVLDEAAWAGAPVTSGLTQTEPIEGASPTQPTEIRIIYDDEAIYVGARMRDPVSVSTRLARRDAFLRDSDWLRVSFDSYHDHLTAFRFSVNPSGVRGDQIMTGEGGFRGGDDTWNPVWDAATSIDADGWTAELRIPFSQLRYRNRDDLVWGIQIERDIARNRENLVLAFTPKSDPGGIPRYGHLVGLSNIPAGERLELLPYVAARAEYRDVEFDDDAGFENPYGDESEFFGRAGLDLKYRLTSNLTLDATVNPDFGQVEADPAEINLSAFETRFDERRTFFIEGADIFDFGGGGGGPGGGGGGSLFYSRRIGRAPRGDVPDQAVYSDVPDATTILGAAKVTGKTAGWSIGVLEALTGRETAPFVDVDQVGGEAVVAPLSNYFVARASREMQEGESVVGGIFTATNRDLDDADLRAELRASAYTGGIDFEHAWADRSWSLSGHAVAMRIAGSPSAIADAQTSSARYYRRPDADHLDYDPDATSLTGYSAGLRLEKEGGLHWRGSADFGATSPGYEINDLGFQRRADEVSAGVDLRYVENSPGELFREWNVQVGHSRRWNYGGDLLSPNLNLGFRAVLLNYWDLNFNIRHEVEAYDDRFTRGGPLTLAPASTDFSMHFSSDFRKPITLRGRIGRQTGEAGHSTSANVTIGFRPTDRISIDIGPDYSRRTETAQYVADIEDPTATETFGTRYVFANLEQSELGIDLRLNVTFRPGITLELFAQPFVGSGDYGAFKELVAPRTYDFAVYGEDRGTIQPNGDDEFLVDPDAAGPAGPFTLDDEDFNVRSLHGNAVFRWEWRPGSTLFLVWQQVRQDNAFVGGFDATRDLRSLLSVEPENIFMIKMSYWLSP